MDRLRPLQALLLYTLLPGCDPREPPPPAAIDEQQASVAAARALVEIMTATGLEADSSAATLQVCGQPFEATAIVESQSQLDGQHLVGLRVELAAPGLPAGTPAGALAAGSVGIGITQAEAVDVAVAEWAQLYGQALAGALAGTTARSIQVGPYRAAPGATGIRGAQPAAWNPVLDRQALTERVAPELEQILPGSHPAGLHSLDLVLMVEGEGPPQGECRVDGQASPELCAALADMPWPRAEPGYLLKQVYLLVPPELGSCASSPVKSATG